MHHDRAQATRHAACPKARRVAASGLGVRSESPHYVPHNAMNEAPQATIQAATLKGMTPHLHEFIRLKGNEAKKRRTRMNEVRACKKDREVG